SALAKAATPGWRRARRAGPPTAPGSPPPRAAVWYGAGVRPRGGGGGGGRPPPPAPPRPPPPPGPPPPPRPPPPPPPPRRAGPRREPGAGRPEPLLRVPLQGAGPGPLLRPVPQDQEVHRSLAPAPGTAPLPLEIHDSRRPDRPTVGRRGPVAPMFPLSGST